MFIQFGKPSCPSSLHNWVAFERVSERTQKLTVHWGRMRTGLRTTYPHHLPTMLKRQRPSSPSPITPEVSLEDLSGDLYQPDPKRRKYFSSSKPPNPILRSEQPDTNDSDNEVDDGREEYFVGRREWQKEAGLYKDANVLLHDLHAEQRHRMLFNTSTLSSFLHRMNPQGTGYLQDPSQVGHDEPQAHSSHIPLQGYSQPGCSEAQRVSHCYEDTNRYGYFFWWPPQISNIYSRFLGSLFLSRRRELQHEPRTSHTP